jgi:serine/threonine protein kinase
MTTLNPKLTVGSRLSCHDGSCYWVESFVGAGGTAQVFAVRDEAGRRLAAKVLSDHRFDVSDEMRARFKREGKVLERSRSPNIVKFVGLTEWRDEPLMLLEYADGGSVASILSALATPPLTVSLRWLREALGGVSALHSENTVHRDISPKNLLVRADGTIAVADFGTVRHVDDETLTLDEATLGSLIYISRQQFDAPRTATARDDVYSLGQVAWQLLTGRRPVGNPPQLTTLRPDISTGLAELIERMRHDDDGQRPPDAGTALAELSNLHDVLVKPVLRRSPWRHTAQGEPIDNTWSASVRAIATRQRNALAALGLTCKSAKVLWALDLLVAHLGPLRFEEPETPRATYEMDGDLGLLPRWLLSGSVTASLDAKASTELFTLTNKVTGLTLSYAQRKPHVIQDAPWPSILDELHALDEWTLEEQLPLFRIFAADQFARGVPCAVCGSVTGSALRLMRDRGDNSRLFRAAICSHDGPSDEFLCSICGGPFRPGASRDEYGPYDAVACGCPGLAFDVEFEEKPWKAGDPLNGAEAADLFESS